jgi:hypothetical protein
LAEEQRQGGWQGEEEETECEWRGAESGACGLGKGLGGLGCVEQDVGIPVVLRGCEDDGAACSALQVLADRLNIPGPAVTCDRNVMGTP